VLKPSSTELPYEFGARTLLDSKKPQLRGKFGRFFVIIDQGQHLQVKVLHRKREIFVLTCENTKTHEQRTLTLPIEKVLGLLAQTRDEETRTGLEQIIVVDMDKKEWGSFRLITNLERSWIVN
jgi:hypothetical protein